VRYWHAVVEVRHVSLGGLDKLGAAFPNVQSVQVNIHTSYQADSEKPEYRKATLRHWGTCLSYTSWRRAFVLRTNRREYLILSKLAIVGGGEQWCRRRILEWDDEKRRNVEVEVPDTWANAKPGNDYRFTTKEMRR
jgi:hypothetical protein